MRWNWPGAARKWLSTIWAAADRGGGESRNAADLVVQEIRDLGGQAVANYDSVSTREGGAAIVQSAIDGFGRVDICINNAGFLRNSRFEDLTDQQIEDRKS